MLFWRPFINVCGMIITIKESEMVELTVITTLAYCNVFFFIFVNDNVLGVQDSQFTQSVNKSVDSCNTNYVRLNLRKYISSVKNRFNILTFAINVHFFNIAVV